MKKSQNVVKEVKKIFSVSSIYKMETERKLLKIPLGFRSKIPRRGIYEYQRPENFAKHNAL